MLDEPAVDPRLPRLFRPFRWIASSSARYLLAVFVVALAFRLATFKGAALGGYDENIYRTFAQALGEEGLEGIRLLTLRAPTDEVLSKGPLPLRIGFVAASTLACKLLGGYELANLAWLSFASGLAAVVFGAALLRAWIGPRWSLVGALFLITSPLAVALSRRALQDAFFAMLTTGCVLAFHASYRRPSPARLALLGASLTAALLTKETSAVLYLCFFALALAYRRAAPPPPRLWIPLIAGPLIALLVLLSIVGDLGSLYATYAAYYQRQGTIDYALIHQRGPWFRYLIDLFLLAPVASLLTVAGIAATPPDDDARRGRLLCALYALSFLAALGALPFQNVRLALPLDAPLRGLAALGVAALGRALPGASTSPARRLAPVLLGAALVLAADVQQLARIFLNGKVYDPVTQKLITSQGFYNPPPQPPR